ncbi:MAG: hypothetical protein HQM08_12455 [Candidatus Riflebacteria bacterium]|nr:hypothetical protein [Candidatus Riflebacteria bacterium]
MYSSIVVITRKTELDELSEKFNTKAQANFYLDQFDRSLGEAVPRTFRRYQVAYDNYQRSFDQLISKLPRTIKHQVIDRSFLTNFKFSGDQLIITLGPDGLVVNTAKYLTMEPILAFNPDPERIDGVLLPFASEIADWCITSALTDSLPIKCVSMAKAQLNDGQALHGFNDIFIGVKSHVSARYRIEIGKKFENHSSSGIIVSTGAGSTGWLQSVINGSFHVASGLRKKKSVLPENASYKLDWSDEKLYYAVREPFVSKSSQAGIVFGLLEANEQIKITSYMAENGVIFSDGMENDFLCFNAGTNATISVSEKKARLFVSPTPHLRRSSNA